MLAMLVMATALTRITFVHTMPTDERHLRSYLVKEVFSEDDMTPDFTEQLERHDHESDIKKRYKVPGKKSKPPAVKAEVQNTTAEDPSNSGMGHTQPPSDKERLTQLDEVVDIVDREDHFTQILADQLVNTDSEITSLQASEIEDERDRFEVKEDNFFTFLTGQEKAYEDEGA